MQRAETLELGVLKLEMIASSLTLPTLFLRESLGLLPPQDAAQCPVHLLVLKKLLRKERDGAWGDSLSLYKLLLLSFHSERWPAPRSSSLLSQKPCVRLLA